MIVHILRSGRALCGQPETPNLWPVHHVWTGWNEAGRVAKDDRCTGCYSRWAADTKLTAERAQRERAGKPRTGGT